MLTSELEKTSALHPIPLGVRIKELRVSNRLTRVELAGRTTVSAPYIYRIERGANPSLELAKQIARAFDLSAEQLTQGTNTNLDNLHHSGAHSAAKSTEIKPSTSLGQINKQEANIKKLGEKTFHWMPVIRIGNFSNSSDEKTDDWDSADFMLAYGFDEGNSRSRLYWENFGPRYLPIDVLALLLLDLNNIPLLDRNQTLELVKARQEVDEQIQETPETAKNTLEPLKDWQNNILEEITKGNLRLILFVIKKEHFYSRQLTFADHFQAGFEGLKKAAEHYNGEFGGQFSTYAYIAIDRAIRRAIMDQNNTIRIPVYIQNMRSAFNRLRSQANLDPRKLLEAVNKACSRDMSSLEEVEKHLHIAENAVALSLDERVLKYGSRILEETEDLNSESLEERVIAQEDVECLKMAIQSLTPNQKQVLALRFGLDPKHPGSLTQDEVGHLMGITRQRVQKLEVSALSRLAKNKKLKEIREIKA